MALGKRRDGGNYLPIIKFDARVGTFYLQDRVNSGGEWHSEQRDVTDKFRAAFDLGTLQRGWIRFPKGAAPETTLVPAGEDPGDSPSDEHREGIRLLLKMSRELGGDVRELMSTARGLWGAIDTLHDEYLAATAEHPGEVPVVVLSDVREAKTAAGATFVPIFEIADWIARPSDLADAPKTVAKGQRSLPLSKPAAKRTVKAPPSADMDDEIPF